MVESWLLWIIGGLLLSLLELIGGQFVFLAIGVSCLFGSAVARFTDYGFKWQLGITALAAAILIPLFVVWYKAKMQPKGRATIGEGAETNEQYPLVENNGRIGVKIQGDFFPAKHANRQELQAGVIVKVMKMDGITAIVERID